MGKSKGRDRWRGMGRSEGRDRATREGETRERGESVVWGGG